MELKRFAENILWEGSLQSKLAQPAGFSDAAPGKGFSGIEAPARPPGLLLPPRGVRVPSTFPKEGQLDRDEARGQVLHHFANHELLALELMAVALLRFPEAPAAFRLGLAHTMREEQRHLALYLDRMRTLGVEPGEAPVNRFFWDCLEGAPTPLDFVARMSLTLEQANLDFAVHYQQLFARLGDHETAAILAEVHRDEIGHVRHGVKWFGQWRDPAAQSDWDAYAALLTLPLTPSRAKGIGFDEASRREAGLSEEFIQTLKAYSHSKGRPPLLYWFNASWEEELADPRASFSPAQATRAVEADLGSVLLFVAKADDVVWVERPPSAPFLAQLVDAGYELPQLAGEARALGDRPFARFEPWGRSTRAERFARGLGVAFREEIAWPDAPRYASKAWAAQLAGDGFATVRATRAAIDAELARLLPLGWAVLKAPLGASGRNAIRIEPKLGVTDAQARWIDKVLAAQGALVVEPWVDRVADFSVQVVAGEPGKTVLGVTRFLTDSRGQYLGHRLHGDTTDLGPEINRWLHENGVVTQLEATGRRVAEALGKEGHRGPAGVDAFLYRTRSGELALRSLVEVNPRYTMGRVALGVEKRVHHAIPAVWVHVTGKKAGGDFQKLAADMLTRHPVELRGGLISAGMLPTNDPATATALLTMLVVGPRALADAQSWW